MKNIIYLFGSGSTTGEYQYKYRFQDNPTSVYNISKNVLIKSRKKNGDFHKVIDSLDLIEGDYIDVEILISLFESGKTRKKKFQNVADELRTLYREYLIEQTSKEIDPLLTKMLLKTHKDYSSDIGDSGERLLGIMTTNYDDLIERAFCDNHTYSGLNYSYPFESDEYPCNVTAPFLLKLHGSFNWNIQGKELNVSKIDSEDDIQNGWVPPSIFKNPELEQVFNSIWDLAEHFLKNCDVLRIIGCDLRTEDFALLGLIFRCQQACYDRGRTPFSIQLIVPIKSAEKIVKRLHFLTEFTTLDELLDEGNFESYNSQKNPNAYHVWINDFIEKVSSQNSNILKEPLFMKVEELK